MTKIGGTNNANRTQTPKPTPTSTPKQAKVSTPKQSTTGHSSQNTFETPTAGQVGSGLTVGGAPGSALTNLADDSAKVVRGFANTARSNVAKVFAEGGEAALNATNAHRTAANLESAAARTASTASRLKTTGKVLGVVGGAFTAIDQSTNSSAESTEAKVLSGTLAGTATYAVGMTNPYLAASDAVANLAGAPDTPGNVLNKSIDTIVTIGEAAVNQDMRAIDNLNARNLRGDNGVVFQAAAEAGEYWAEHGIIGGLSNFWDAVTN